MERLSFTYPARHSLTRRAHVGVVGSGDLEVLLEPSSDPQAHVSVTTSVDGFGATPGVVMLRLEQAAEALRT